MKTKHLIEAFETIIRLDETIIQLDKAKSSYSPEDVKQVHENCKTIREQIIKEFEALEIFVALLKQYCAN